MICNLKHKIYIQQNLTTVKICQEHKSIFLCNLAWFPLQGQRHDVPINIQGSLGKHRHVCTPPFSAEFVMESQYISIQLHNSLIILVSLIPPDSSSGCSFIDSVNIEWISSFWVFRNSQLQYWPESSFESVPISSVLPPGDVGDHSFDELQCMRTISLFKWSTTDPPPRPNWICWFWTRRGDKNMVKNIIRQMNTVYPEVPSRGCPTETVCSKMNLSHEPRLAKPPGLVVSPGIQYKSPGDYWVSPRR